MTRRLFLLETRRMLRHPLVWGTALLVLALQTFLTRDQQPDLSVDPVRATGMSTCLAAAVLVVASLAVSRDGRHGMPESLASLPGRAVHRTRAVLAASALTGGLAAALTTGCHLGVRLLSGPAGGRLDVWEPLTAVAASVLAAVLGVATGRWVRWLVAGPMVTAALGFLILFNDQNGAAGWLLPVMQEHSADWPDRPSGVHLVYVLALAVAFAGIALLRHRARIAPAVAAVAALAVAVPAGAAAAARPPVVLPGSGELTMDGVDPRVRERFFGPGARSCAARRGITYCAYRGYEPWIPLWEEAVLPIADLLPAPVRARLPHVEQVAPDWSFAEDTGDDWRIRPPMTWGGPDQRAMVAQDVAFWAAWRGGRAPADQETQFPRGGCDAHGQARVLVALWLSGQVSPPEQPRPLHLDARHARMMTVRWGDAEVGYAKALLALPGAAEAVRAHWDVLLDPATTIERALPLLGLRRTADTPPGATPCR
ncbi:hypothetical protein AB0L05_07460 [Nonomuraea pusilla]|uniref:hypothetical protein n=1 Tax=Nonomuraea pusilla TaxID=46177 RepID=UPI0033341D80